MNIFVAVILLRSCYCCWGAVLLWLSVGWCSLLLFKTCLSLSFLLMLFFFVLVFFEQFVLPAAVQYQSDRTHPLESVLAERLSFSVALLKQQFNERGVRASCPPTSVLKSTYRRQSSRSVLLQYKECTCTHSSIVFEQGCLLSRSEQLPTLVCLFWSVERLNLLT